eukprot:10421139-Heterocapsa_arctica.AAC.1
MCSDVEALLKVVPQLCAGRHLREAVDGIRGNVTQARGQRSITPAPPQTGQRWRCDLLDVGVVVRCQHDPIGRPHVRE